MGKSNYLPKTKHDAPYLIYLLLKRFEIEIGKGNYHEANLVAHNLSWLYPGEKDAKLKLEGIYLAKAEGLLHKNNLKEVEKAINSALELENENPRFLLLLTHIKGKTHSRLEHSQGVRIMVHRFIQAYFPEELPLFDLAWRVFKDIGPEDFTQEAVSGALGIVGREASTLKSPKVIVLFNQISSEKMPLLSGENVREAVAEIGRATGCRRELMDKITEFILTG